jgi:hypothetical protein
MMQQQTNQHHLLCWPSANRNWETRWRQLERDGGAYPCTCRSRPPPPACTCRRKLLGRRARPKFGMAGSAPHAFLDTRKPSCPRPLARSRTGRFRKCCISAPRRERSTGGHRSRVPERRSSKGQRPRCQGQKGESPESPGQGGTNPTPWGRTDLGGSRAGSAQGTWRLIA